MSSGDGATGGDGGVGGDGAMITDSVRERIQHIREITGKLHSDDDIFTVLKECSWDPNDTAQKLLYLDTFHEVKRKRDRKKEAMHTQSRGARSSRGNYSDAFGGRGVGSRRENGVNHMIQKGSTTSLRATQTTDNKEAASRTRVSNPTPRVPSSLTNGCATLGHGQELPVDGVVITDSLVADVKKQDIASLQSAATHSIFGSMIQGVQGKATSSSNGFPASSTSGATASLQSAAQSSAPHLTFGTVVQGVQGKSTSSSNGCPRSNAPASASSAPGVYSSTSDSILAHCTAWHPSDADTTKCEVGNQLKVDEQHPIQGNRHVSHEAGPELPNKEKSASMIVNSIDQNETPSASTGAEGNHLAEPPQLPALSTHDESLAVRSLDGHSPKELATPSKALVSSIDEQAKASPQSLPESTISNGHVTFPDHFKVPDALKSGLIFGNFDANPGLRSNYGNSNGCDTDSSNPVKPLRGADESTREPSSSNESGSATMLADHADKSAPPHHALENVPLSEVNAAPSADSKGCDSKQEAILLPETHHISPVQVAPNYGFGIMAMQGTHFVPIESHETQARDVSLLSSYTTEVSASSSSPSLTPVQNAVAASSPPVMFRPQYHPNYVQYGHYLAPYFLQPMHQFLSHNGLPQQSSNGNAYLAPSTTPKFPLPQFQPVASAGNPTPMGLPPFYCSYSSSPIGLNPGSGVTSGSSTNNEDMSASQSKESHIYTTGPLNEASAWIPQQGQDITRLQLNSLYQLPPLGQHIAFSPQTGHAPISGLYPPLQTMTAPSTVNPLRHQPQAMPAAIETVGHPASAYQQPQPAPLQCNSSY